MCIATFSFLKDPRNIFFVTLFALSTFSIQAQQPQELRVQFEEETQAKEQRVLQYLLQTGFEKRVTSSDNKTIFEIIDIKDGFPIYYKTLNKEGGEVIKADRVYPGGSSNLQLTGAGQTLGIWDGGGTLTTHSEFTARVAQMDTPVALSDHATHVAGTMMAAGVANLTFGLTTFPQGAKGMSYAANLWAYDWNSDVTEMSTAANNGLQVSQHSYGLISGWANGNFSNNTGWHWFGNPTVSTSQDASFGYYDGSSRNWDLLSNFYPNYLIVKSAGNDRGEGPNPGESHYFFGNGWTLSTDTRDVDGGLTGYDCVTDAGNAKNVLTVGAITTAGAMSSFSGWGPTDDGRVKPDLVAKGVSVLSTGAGANDAYYFSNGTSMSGPMISGAMGLLFEHQENLHPGKKLKAATLKGLAIHTANDQVGGSAAGPDYRFGWGLMDVEKAAIVMEDNSANGIHIFEEQLTQNEEWYIPIQATGIAPLRVTLVWNDPAASVTALALNNRTPKLVNDLDLRILHSVGNSNPYVLDPDNPALAATTGDNFRDNVEMVHIETPIAGNYVVKVSHKGSLSGGQQAFSLIITGNEEVTTLADLSLIPSTANLLVSGEAAISGALEISGLRVPASASLTLEPNSHLTINDDLMVEEDGVLHLKSDATGYAQLKIGTSANISALGKIQQEQLAANTGWHNIGIPLIGETAEELGSVSASGGAINLTKWNANTSEWEPVQPTETLERGVGYSAFVGDFGVIPVDSIVAVSGTPTVSFTPLLAYHDGVGSSISFSDPATASGWNFIANPFTAGLDFSAIPSGNFTNTNNAFYIWNPAKGTNGGYEVWSAGASPNDISSVIPPLQGFWVRTTASGASLGTLTTDFTTISAAPSFLKAANITDHIEIQLWKQDVKQDHLTLALHPETKLGYDADWDAVKLIDNTSGASIFSKGEQPLAINAIDFSTNHFQPILLPLGLKNVESNLFSLRLNTEFLSFDATVYLWNKTDGELRKMNNTSLALPENSKNKSLYLVFANQATIEESALRPIIISQDNRQIEIINNGYTGKLTASVLDMNGRDVMRTSFQMHIDRQARHVLNTSQLPTGTYVLHLHLDNGEVIVHKLLL